MLLLLCLNVLAVVDDDTYTVQLVFEKMHCDECRTTVEANAKVLKNVKGVSVDGDTATLSIADGTAPDLGKFRLAVPGDLKLKAVVIVARGTLSAKGDVLLFSLKGGPAALALADREKQEKLAELRKQLGGKNRFEISGELVEIKKAAALLVDSFKTTDWKDR